jgi:hypothetical protein
VRAAVLRREFHPSQHGFVWLVNDYVWLMVDDYLWLMVRKYLSGWWFEPSEKYKNVNGKNDIP